jgi:DNA-binding phage protein
VATHHRRVGGALVAGLGGVAGGLLVWLLGPLAPPSPLAVPRTSGSAAIEANHDSREVAERVEELEELVAALRRRSAAREALAAFTLAAQAQTDEDADANTLMAPVIDEDDPTFELAVRGVMDRIQQEKNLAREAQRVLKRADRANRLTLLLAEELQLTESQQEDVEQIFTDQFARYRELRQAARDDPDQAPTTPRQKQERKQQIREQTERETERRLAEVLDPNQLAQFREIRDEEELKPGG